VDAWRERTPSGFLFCPKLPGEITHEKMLEGADEQVAAFTDVISRLGEKLGPILVQPHPSFAHDQLPKLETFLSRLPAGFRYAVEFRHRSWADHADGLPGCGHSLSVLHCRRVPTGARQAPREAADLYGQIVDVLGDMRGMVPFPAQLDEATCAREQRRAQAET
jgi:hypothetical protein